MKCIEEGDECGAFCGGHLVASTPEHCACHIVAPCGACENAGFECSECGRKDDDPAPVPEIETLARAIFETDSSVISFVREKSETIESDRTPHGITRWNRAMDVAWATNANGRRSTSVARAQAIIVAVQRIEQQ